ncbi:MAG: hypothetical protein IKI15_03340 [Lachnospiraceae bacterium]|nr:hypothetical protein [Lachnospiraceae bacterium]
MRGKDKCKILKQIRKQIAEENDIPYVVEECKHKGECKGTCPKCEADLRMLERELSLRYRLGKTVAIAGIAAGMMTMTTGCGIDDAVDLLHQLIGIEVPGPDIQGELMPPEAGVIDSEPLAGDVQIDPDWEDVTEGEAVPPEYKQDYDRDYDDTRE